MSNQGTLSSWNDARGFGFITPDDGSDRVFVHISGFDERRRRPETGQLLRYSLSQDARGRYLASDVVSLEQSRGKRGKGGALSWLMLLALLFLLTVLACVLIAKLPRLVLAWYLLASLLTFVVYAADKSAARRGAWRTSENTLHLMSLLGGWPGALFAQQILRHKSRKQAFQGGFWLTVVLNCGAFIWLLTPIGSARLQSWILYTQASGFLPGW